MLNKSSSVLMVGLLAATAATASAGGQAKTLGVGAELMAGDVVPAASVAYDFGMFHAAALLSFSDPAGPDNTSTGVGGRFYFHLHSTAMSDFSLGGSLDAIFAAGDTTLVFIGAGIQARVFVATNVALSGNAGLTIGAADADGIAMGGMPVAGFGFHYFFF